MAWLDELSEKYKSEKEAVFQQLKEEQAYEAERQLRQERREKEIEHLKDALKRLLNKVGEAY